MPPSSGAAERTERITAPAWDPDDFADAILAKLDKNTDGAVDKPELAAAPGLAWGAKYIDTDKNGALSRDELVQRFAMYVKMRLGLTTKQFQVSYKGRPVTGAKSRSSPSSFSKG